jgi:hypothetical protein
LPAIICAGKTHPIAYHLTFLRISTAMEYAEELQTDSCAMTIVNCSTVVKEALLHPS